MIFIDREDERRRLTALTDGEGGLAVVFGRRRIGKTRLLVEWAQATGGIYTVADQSTPELQRKYFARAVSDRLPGFADVDYPDWRALLARLAKDAASSGFSGPVIFDELPYLVAQSPELPSILQQWLDHDAKRASLATAVAGSSQRMMQGLTLDADSPLYGRAREVIELGPLPIGYVGRALPAGSASAMVQAFAAWGGVPRYWELARDASGTTPERVESLVLDPRGPLHREPDRLLVEELPPALEVRPVLDAIGGGAHRVSEIAARMGRPATSLSRALDRLVGLGLATREVPFGEPEKSGKRSLYQISEPFFRLWFRVVAPNRAQLVAANRKARLALLSRHWDGLLGSCWEDLVRAHVSRCPGAGPGVDGAGPFGPARRWWRGAAPEWDVVSESLDRRRLLVGEAKWSARAVRRGQLERWAHALLARPLPPLPGIENRRIVRCLFVPTLAAEAASAIDGVQVVTGAEILAIPA